MQKVQTLPICSGPHASMYPPAQDQAGANGTDGLGGGGGGGMYHGTTNGGDGGSGGGCRGGWW